MIRSFLLLSSCIASAFSAESLGFSQSPGNVSGVVGGSAVMVWEYDLEGGDLLGIRYDHIDEKGQLSIIMNVDANGNGSPGPGFPHASFRRPATITLNPLQDSDVGEVKCTIYRSNGAPVSDLVSITIVPPDDQKDVIITLKVSDKKVECGQQTIIDSDETIVVEVPVESDSGAPMEVNAFQKCGEDQENQIGTECTKGSGVCTFGTSAGCDGFTKGLVTIRATVKHPAFDEAKEDTCSYTVPAVTSDGLEDWEIAVIVIGVLIILLIPFIVVNVIGCTSPDRIPSWLRWAACCKKQEPTLDPEQPRLDGDTKKAPMKGGRLSPLAPNKVVPDETANQESGEEKKKKKKKKRKKEKKELQELSDF